MCGIRYKFTVQNTNTSQLCNFMVQHSDGPPEAPAIGVATVMERRDVRSYNVGANTSRPTICKGYMATGKPWGLSKQDFMADEDFEANFGTNPVKTSFINMYATTMHTSCILNVKVEMMYYVECLRRVKVTGS